MKKILQTIFSVKNDETHKILTILGLKFKFRNSSKENEQVISKLDRLYRRLNEVNRMSLERTKRITPKPFLSSFVVDVASHCNLNCRGCDHFSPLSEEKFYDFEQYKSDIKRLSELSQNIGQIALMGGEPFLNPRLIEFLRVTREYLPDTRIFVLSNGILIPAQKDEFWQEASKLNIEFEYTKYDLKIDYSKFDEISKKFNIKLKAYGPVLKTSSKIPLDLDGDQNPIVNFLNCSHANQCITLKDGKMYTCTVAPNIDIFNKYFNKNIPLSKYDGIDIYEAKSMEEILKFLAQPIPFCRYCNVNKRTQGHPWGISCKDISEWTVQ